MINLISTIWSTANSHPQTSLYQIKSINLRAHASSEACETCQLDASELLLMLRHRAVQHSLWKAPSALFYIHDLTDAHYWLVIREKKSTVTTLTIYQWVSKGCSHHFISMCVLFVCMIVSTTTLQGSTLKVEHACYVSQCNIVHLYLTLARIREVISTHQD